MRGSCKEGTDMRLGLICSHYVPLTFSRSQGAARETQVPLDIPIKLQQNLLMNLFRALLLAFSLIVSSPAFAQIGDQDWLYRGSDIARDPDWRFGTLANGLRYAVRRNALPEGQVSIRVRIDAGSLHEEDHERGWAH